MEGRWGTETAKSAEAGRPMPNHRGGPMADDLSGAKAIFGRVYPGLRRFASAVAPVDIDPDDLVQDALEAVLRTDRLSELDDPDAYLRRAIINRLSNERRSLGRRRVALHRLGPSPPEEAVYPSDLAWLAKVPPLSRAVVYLHHVDGYTHAEVGDLVGLSERAARTRCNRATRQLHRLLEEEAQ